MKPLWHPLSTILLSDPRCFATDSLVRMLLAKEHQAALVYAGDRMWPALRHGAGFTVEPAADHALLPGTVVLASHAGLPDLLRITAADDEAVTLTADADPDTTVALPRDAVLARARLPAATPDRRLATLRRIALELRESWTQHPSLGEDSAATVREKYEAQATFYARTTGADLDPRLLARLRARVPAGGTVLVVGSGAGRECLALARAGWNVGGVEFAPAMVVASRKEALRRGLEIDFSEADIREHHVDPGTLDGILFTYDVYSFLPARRERIGLLRRMRSWLRPGGVLLLSARRLLSPYDRLILSLQWLAHARRGEGEWGDSHTRWISNDGTLHRSFVHVFSAPQLQSETNAAGFRGNPWEGGHCALVPESPAIIVG